MKNHESAYIREQESKVEVMGQYLIRSNKLLDSAVVCNAVYHAFGIRLDEVPVLDERIAGTVPTARAAIDLFIQQSTTRLDGQEIRGLLNQTFGINLNGINTLEKERISLYSKGQWISKGNKDVFEIRTGRLDIDVQVVPADYFQQHAHSDLLPEELINELAVLGYRPQDNGRACYYCNSKPKPVADAFKGQTIRAIAGIIRKNYSDF